LLAVLFIAGSLGALKSAAHSVNVHPPILSGVTTPRLPAAPTPHGRRHPEWPETQT
jgi:hypothetical protein